MALSKQSTLDDIYALDYIKNLNKRQVNIIRFLEQGYHQAEIARRLKCDRSLVNRTVKKLEEYKLIIAERIYIQLNNKNIFKKNEIGKIKAIATADPWCGRATTYIITPKLKNLLNQLPSTTNTNYKGDYTLAKIHYLKFKYPILSQSGEIDTTGWRKARSNTIHIRSWKPKGNERHQFHVDTPNGVIGIEYHGKSLIAYPIERRDVMANGVEDLIGISAAYVQEGVSKFIQEQHQIGNCTLHLGDPIRKSDPHYAFESNIAKELTKAGKTLSTLGLTNDDSLKAKNLKRGDYLGEIETSDINLATEVDIALRNAYKMPEKILHLEAKIDDLSQLEAKINDLHSSLTSQLSVQASQVNNVLESTVNSIKDSLNKYTKNIEPLIMGGTTAEFKVNQLMGVVGKEAEIQILLKKDNARLRDEMSELRKIIENQNSAIRIHEETINRQNKILESVLDLFGSRTDLLSKTKDVKNPPLPKGIGIIDLDHIEETVSSSLTVSSSQRGSKQKPVISKLSEKKRGRGRPPKVGK